MVCGVSLEKRGKEVAGFFQFEGEVEVLADSLLDTLAVFPAFDASFGFEVVVEAIAFELEFLAAVFGLEEADEDAGREVGVVEVFEGAQGDEVAGLVEELGGLFRGGRETGCLFLAPWEDVASVEAPDGHAGSCYSVGGAEVGSGLPAVGGAGRWVFEEDHEFVQERDGVTFRVFGGFEAVMEGFDSGDLRGKCRLHAHK